MPLPQYGALAWRPSQGTKLCCLVNRGTLGVNKLPIARIMLRPESNPRWLLQCRWLKHRQYLACVCIQEHLDGHKEEKPKAPDEVRLHPVTEDHDAKKDTVTSPTDSPKFGKPAASKPKGVKCSSAINCTCANGNRLRNNLRSEQPPVSFNRTF